MVICVKWRKTRKEQMMADANVPVDSIAEHAP